ncbi:MAG: histidine kinase [Promicromonosporaceae bacterium]|nr:histidine kinase [Promicromonosporaceae bacterium]
MNTAEPASSAVGGGALSARITRSGAGRDWLHAYARRRLGRVVVSVQVVLLVAVLLVLLLGVGDVRTSHVRIVVLLVAGAFHAVGCSLAWRYGLFEPARAECGARVDRHSPWMRLGVALVILSAGQALVLDLPSQRLPALPVEQILGGLMLVTTVAVSVATFSPLLTSRLAVLAPAAVTALFALGQSASGMAPQWELWAVAILLGYLLMLRLKLSNWHERLWAEWEADLDLLAALAASQERLTLARDIHDTIGQTLAAVALKADVAQRLFERGDPRAIKEAREMSRLARQAIKETRGLSRELRQTDLRTELVSARALLDDLSVRLRVTGTASAWPPGVLAVLGWVVREATTNVTRHAQPTFVRVELETRDATARLTFTNDGVRTPVDLATTLGTEGGSGLAGLTERLAAVGGTLAHRRTEESFILLAEIPLPRSFE